MNTSGVRRQRLLCLIGQLGYGGSERQLYLFMKHLDKRRYEPHVLVFNPSNNDVYDEPLAKVDVKVWSIPDDRRNLLTRAAYVQRVIRAVKPEIMHSWSAYLNPYVALLGRINKVEVRFGSLRSSLKSSGLKELPLFHRKLALGGLHRIVVNSHAAGLELVENGSPPERVAVVYNCVETANGTSVASNTFRAEIGIDESARLVGIIGNLRKVKNHLLFLDAMQAVVGRVPRAKALIVGQPIAQEPTYPQEIKERIAGLSLEESVIMAGFRPDIADVLACLDVLCVPSADEGMPNVILEAMSIGCPVVATRVGGITEVLQDGVTGWVVPSGDSSELARTICAVLESPDESRRRIAAARREIETRFGCPTMAGQIVELYERHLGRPKGNELERV